MNFSTVVPMLNSVDRLLKLLKLSLSTDITEFEYNNLQVVIHPLKPPKSPFNLGE